MSLTAYLNGQYVDADHLAVSVTDTGFMMGVTVSEQIRTFGGEPFRLSDHLERLSLGLRTIGLDSRVSVDELPEIVNRIVAKNRAYVDSEDDLGISIFVTPGVYPSFQSDRHNDPTIGVHTYPLPFRFWSDHYASGLSLESVSVEQISPRAWPPQLKCRSRMHYYLATQEARRDNPLASALLYDANGNVSETPTANVVALFDDGFASPRREMVLAGVSLNVLQQLAGRVGIPLNYRTIEKEELCQASEILTTSTPYCLLPVTVFDSRPVGNGVPGERYRQLLEAWSEMVGVDIARQARRFAERHT